jgi:hypothetical protein
MVNGYGIEAGASLRLGSGDFLAWESTLQVLNSMINADDQREKVNRGNEMHMPIKRCHMG